MSLSASLLAQTFVGVCNLANFIDSSLKADSENDQERKVILTYEKYTKGTIVALDVLFGIAKLSKAQESTLASIKVAEFMTHFVNIPLQITAELSSPNYTHYDFFVKGVLIPFSAMINNACWLSVHEEENFLKMLEKDPNAKRPIYEDDGENGVKIVGYRAIDPEECKKTIEESKESMDQAILTRIVAEGIIGNNKINLIKQGYRRLVNGAQNGAHNVAVNNVNNGYFSSLNHIPNSLNDDIVLNRNICVISHSPIRHLVIDPNGISTYERENIVSWLTLYHTSPVTRRPLFEDELIVDIARQNIIDTRLAQHDRQIEEYLLASPELQTRLAEEP